MQNNTAYIPQAEDFVFVQSADAEAAEAVGGAKHETLKRFLAAKTSIPGVVILCVLLFLSIIGPYLSGHSYAQQELTMANMAPRVPVLSAMGILDGSESVPKTSGAVVQNKYEEQGLLDTWYLFGTDNLGRDLFSRCFMGLRISLIIALAATAINLLIGMNYGIVSAYFGGTTDIIMQRIVDVIGSIPTLVVVTLLMLVLKPGMGSIIFALMLSGWIDMSLIARSQTLKVKEQEYVQAARTMGASNFHIIFREIMPNITGKLATQIMLSIPSAVFLEAFLSFVGLGMPAGTCSLGTLLSDGFANAMLHPYKLFPPAVIMILLMAGCHLVAEGVKQATE